MNSYMYTVLNVENSVLYVGVSVHIYVKYVIRLSVKSVV